MKTTGKTAGKTAKTRAAKTANEWRMVHHRDGRQTLIAPDGRKLVGTRRELAEAGLSPLSRRMLADSLKLEHYLALSLTFDAAETRQRIANRRLDAIAGERFHRKLGDHFIIPTDMYILAEASARYMQQTVDEFLMDAVRSSVEGTIDVALSDGEKELPLTRQERAAFKGRQEDYSLALRLKEAWKTA